MPGKKEPNGGDFPWNSGGHVDDEQGRKEDLQLPGNSVRAATTWQPEVQEAGTCQQLVGNSQLQERSEEMSSATCALSRQKIHGCWFGGLSLPQCLHKSKTEVGLFLKIQLFIIPFIRPKQGLETERLLPSTNEKEDLLPVSRRTPLESSLKIFVADTFFATYIH